MPGKMRKELRVNEVCGECELCGFRGKVWRWSRPIEGYTIYVKDGVLSFKCKSVRQMCDPCYSNIALKSFEGLLERNDPQAQKILNQLKGVFRKHGYELWKSRALNSP